MENKPRLIDANKLIQEHGCDVTNWDEPYAVSIRSIECAPTVDAVEVVHGRWEVYPDERYRTCSNCKKIYEWAKMLPYMNYCPHCGAKMDLEEK